MKPQRSLKQIISDSSLGDFIRSVQKLFQYSSKKVYIILGIIFLAVLHIVGLVAGLIAKSNRQISYLSWGSVVGFGFKHFFIVLLIFAIAGAYTVWLLASYRSTVHFDAQKGIHESEENEAGSAHRLQDPKEKAETLRESRWFEETFQFLGEDVDRPGTLLGINEKRRGINNNVLVVGPPGSAKTRALVYNILFQAIRRGESVIVTDSKDVIYGETVMLAQAHGYETKHINFDARRIAHSDGVNLFVPATRSDVECESFAEAIVENLGKEREVGYWPKAEKNCLTAGLLYVKNHPDEVLKGGRMVKDRSLTAVAKLFNNTDAQQLATKYNSNKVEGSQMTACANNWMNSGERARDDAKAGLGMGLTKLINPVIGKVCEENEVNLMLPGMKPCIYYVNLSDTSRSMDFISSLFFEELISELENLADQMPNNELKVPVTLLFEEFANIGRIPGWEDKISTIRSRGIKTIMILQGLEQLEKNYPDGRADTIQNACDIQVLLGTNSLKTAQYFQERSGEVPVMTTQKQVRGEKTGKLFKFYPQYDKRDSGTTRYLYTINELMGMPYPKMLVFIRTQKCVVEMNRIDYTLHPMFREIRRIKAAYHYPEWAKALTPAELAAYELDPAEFKTNEQMLLDSGFDPEAEPYLCTDADFLHPNTDMTNAKKEDITDDVYEQILKRVLASQAEEYGASDSSGTVINAPASSDNGNEGNGDDGYSVGRRKSAKPGTVKDSDSTSSQGSSSDADTEPARESVHKPVIQQPAASRPATAPSYDDDGFSVPSRKNIPVDDDDDDDLFF